MPHQMPITMESVYAVVAGTAEPQDNYVTDRSHLASGIARRMGYAETDPRVHALIKSMAVSGYIKQNPLGAYYPGPTPLPERRELFTKDDASRMIRDIGLMAAARSMGNGCYNAGQPRGEGRPPASGVPFPGQRQPDYDRNDRCTKCRAHIGDPHNQGCPLGGEDDAIRRRMKQHRQSRQAQDDDEGLRPLGPEDYAEPTEVTAPERMWPTPEGNGWVDWTDDPRVHPTATGYRVVVPGARGHAPHVSTIKPAVDGTPDWLVRSDVGQVRLPTSHAALLHAVFNQPDPAAIRRPAPSGVPFPDQERPAAPEREVYYEPEWLTGHGDEDRLTKMGKCPYQTGWGGWGDPRAYCGNERSPREGDGGYCGPHADDIRHDRGYGGPV